MTKRKNAYINNHKGLLFIKNMKQINDKLACLWMKKDFLKDFVFSNEEINRSGLTFSEIQNNFHQAKNLDILYQLLRPNIIWYLLQNRQISSHKYNNNNFHVPKIELLTILSEMKNFNSSVSPKDHVVIDILKETNTFALNHIKNILNKRDRLLNKGAQIIQNILQNFKEKEKKKI